MGSTSVFYTTELGIDLQIQIISYNGDIEINIRKWCLSSYSKTFPTKHRIRLNPQNWTRFVKRTDGHIFADEENDTFHMHIGGGIYISRSPRLQHIHIRQWYMENGEEKQSKTGVCMMIEQFIQRIDRKSEIQKNLPKEARVSPCYLDAAHQNQEGYFMCGYCTPFEYHQTM